MRILLCLLVILFTTASAAETAAGAKSPKKVPSKNLNSGFITKLEPRWFACQKNRDCLVIQGVCGEPLAVSTKDHEKAIRVLASREGGEECAPNPGAGWPMPECKAKKCVLKPASNAPPATSGSGF